MRREATSKAVVAGGADSDGVRGAEEEGRLDVRDRVLSDVDGRSSTEMRDLFEGVSAGNRKSPKERSLGDFFVFEATLL